MSEIRIAAVTDDGQSISQHFGRAPYYEVLTVADGTIIGRERREKLGHAHFAGEHENHSAETEPGKHGFDPASESRHARMAAAIADCQVVLARGMGAGAYHSLARAGIRPILTDIAGIDAAVQAVISGEIVDHVENLH